MVYVAKVRILGRDVMSSEQVIQLDVLTRSLKNVCKDCRGCFILLAPPVMSLGSGALEEMSTAQQFSVTSDFCTLSALEPSSAFTSSLGGQHPRAQRYSCLPPPGKQWSCWSNLTKGSLAWLRRTAQRIWPSWNSAPRRHGILAESCSM